MEWYERRDADTVVNVLAGKSVKRWRDASLMKVEKTGCDILVVDAKGQSVLQEGQEKSWRRCYGIATVHWFTDVWSQTSRVNADQIRSDQDMLKSSSVSFRIHSVAMYNIHCRWITVRNDPIWSSRTVARDWIWDWAEPHSIPFESELSH